MKVPHKITGIFGAVAAAAAMMVIPSGAANADSLAQPIYAGTVPTQNQNGVLVTTRCVEPGGAEPTAPGVTDPPSANGAIITEQACDPVNFPGQIPSYAIWRLTPWQVVSTGGRTGYVFQIKNVSTGFCMESRFGGTGSGIVVDQTTCATGGTADANDQQMWYIVRASNGDPNSNIAPYNLKPWSAVRRGANLCLDVRGGSDQPGTFLEQWSCNGSNAQKFYGQMFDLKPTV